ncbi:SAM-dependent methyltransferase [Chloroflexota bacterium]
MQYRRHFFRALESIQPANKRILHDAYAAQFLSGISKVLLHTRFLISGRLLHKIVNLVLSRIIPGGTNYVIVRTRYIDDCLLQCIEDDIQQLVVLGAGYDSRVFRFTALKERVKIFEVDHPYSQRDKKEKVEKISGDLPNHVIYVPVDFEKDMLDERLFAWGYDKNAKTLFIWEGVTVYLTNEAVYQTLDFVVNNSGEGSSIVFDYVYETVIDGRMEEGQSMKRQAEKAGVPFKFGIEEGTVEEFLGKRGFDKVKDVNAKSLEDRYFKGTNRKSCPCYGIVYATVKPRE